MRRYWKRRIIASGLVSVCAVAQTYKQSAVIAVGGTGGWDYLLADVPAHRLYVSHGTEVDVVDTRTDKVTDKIAGLQRIHGIVVAHDVNTGFISDGGANQVVLFDLKTLAVKSKVQAGTNPDGLVYDPASKRVFAFNGRSNDVTAINASTGAVVRTVALGGKPEFPVSDGQGYVYDNIEDKGEIVQLDSKTLTVKAHWPLAPCESPSGLAIDQSHRRLFAVCSNNMMAVVDADSGKIIATPAIGEHPDAAAFDPQTNLAFSSNGDGTLTVVRESDKNHFSVVSNIPTAKGARTMALDTSTHKIYLSDAEFGAAPAPTAQDAHPRPSIVPDTFKILVFSEQ